MISDGLAGSLHHLDAAMTPMSPMPASGDSAGASPHRSAETASASPCRSVVETLLSEANSVAAGFHESPRGRARRHEAERDAVDARLWDSLRRHSHCRTRSGAWGVEQDTRAVLEHWTPEEIAAWNPPLPSASNHSTHSDQCRSPLCVPLRGGLSLRRSASMRHMNCPGAGRQYSSRQRRTGASPPARHFAEPPFSVSIGLAMAREAGARQAIEARAADAEAEVARLGAELAACRHELARNRQLAEELGTAMVRHQDALGKSLLSLWLSLALSDSLPLSISLATHHRQQAVLAISGEVRQLRHAHQQLRTGAVQEIGTMHRWLSEQLDMLQRMAGQSASLLATERWALQRSLQSHLDTVSQEIKSQVGVDLLRYTHPPSPSTPPHPPWTQAARGVRSKGTPHPSKAAKHPQEILEELSGGRGGSWSRAVDSMARGYLQSPSGRRR